MNRPQLCILFLIIQFFINTTQAQTFWTHREYRIPGHGDKSYDIGLKKTDLTGQHDTLQLAFTYGKEMSADSKWEWEAGTSIGGTDTQIDNYTNWELYGGFMYKAHEYKTVEGHRFIPFGRVGTTFNYFSNYQKNTVGYDYSTIFSGYYTEYYTESGETYLDLYANYSAGLSYISPNKKLAISSEYGQWTQLFGDLTLSPEDGQFWASQVYYELGESKGIKFIYVKEMDYDMDTFGLYYSRSF